MIWTFTISWLAYRLLISTLNNALNVNTFKYSKFSEAFERFTTEVKNTLDDVYGSYSVGKLTAYKYCKWLCEQCAGYFQAGTDKRLTITVDRI